MSRSAEKIQVATAVLFTEERESFLLGRRSEGSMAGYWEFPGGKLEPGESVAEALVRELGEELGIAAIELASLAALGTVESQVNGKVYVLNVMSLVWTRPRPLSLFIVHSEVQWATAPEALAMRLIPSNIQIVGLVKRA